MIVTSKFLTLFMVLSLIYACTFTSSKNSSKTVNHNKYPLYYDTDSICTYLKKWEINNDLLIKGKIVKLNYNQNFWLDFGKELFIDKNFGTIPHLDVSDINFSKKNNYLLSFSKTQNTVKLWNTNNLELKEISKYNNIESVAWCDSNKFYLIQKDGIRLIQIEKGKTSKIHNSSLNINDDEQITQVNYEKKWFLIQKTIVSRLQNSYYLENFDGKKIKELGRTLSGYVRTSYDNNYILLIEENKIRVFDANGDLTKQLVVEEGIGHVKFIKDSYDIQYKYKSKIKVIDINGISKQELEFDWLNFYDVNIFKKSQRYYYRIGNEIVKRKFDNSIPFKITFPNFLKPYNWIVSNDESVILLIDQNFLKNRIIILYLHPKNIIERLNEMGYDCE